MPMQIDATLLEINSCEIGGICSKKGWWLWDQSLKQWDCNDTTAWILTVWPPAKQSSCLVSHLVVHQFRAITGSKCTTEGQGHCPATSPHPPVSGIAPFRSILDTREGKYAEKPITFSHCFVPLQLASTTLASPTLFILLCIHYKAEKECHKDGILFLWELEWKPARGQF